MLRIINNFLKRFLPPPVKTFLREIQGLKSLISQESNRNLKKNEDLFKQIELRLGALEASQKSLMVQLVKMNAKQESEKNQLIYMLDRQQEQLSMLAGLVDGQRQQEKRIMQILEDQQCGRVEIKEELSAQQNWAQTVTSQMLDTYREQMHYLEQLEKLETEMHTVQKGIAEYHTNVMADFNKTEEWHQRLSTAVERVRKQSAENIRISSETVWAEVFNNTITGSSWLKNLEFSPGRWAVGYQYLYAMYRVLNETRPKRILELGLGQSTRMISQYAAAHEDVEHFIVEHDSEWISFFENNFELSLRSTICRLDLEMAPYGDVEAVRGYRGFVDKFGNEQFDLICIDAPLGSDMKQLSRVDVLRIMPRCLSKNFVILFDDCDRVGEKNTADVIESNLKENEVAYKCGKYSGNKDCILFCAEHMSFLTTM